MAERVFLPRRLAEFLRNRLGRTLEAYCEEPLPVYGFLENSMTAASFSRAFSVTGEP